MKCPSTDLLLEYLTGRISLADHNDVAAHLKTDCPDCQEQQGWLGATVQATSGDMSFAFPDEAIAQSVSWFEAQTAEVKTPLSQFLAQLIFDSLMPSQLAPVRSGMAMTSEPVGRQVLYRAGSYDVDLRFESGESAEGEDLIGQIVPGGQLPSAVEGAAVRLLQDEIVVAHAHANTRGVFIFLQIASGIYELKILVPDGEIMINRVATARAS
jgi:hypothetical protein